MQSNLTKALIKDLEQDIKDLKHLDSNMDVVWRLETLQRDNVILRTANLIRKELNRA